MVLPLNFYSGFLIIFYLVLLKRSLFWLYFWQLKEYHIGRLIAHFQSKSGKRLLINKNLFFKIGFLFLAFFSFPYLLFFLFFVYLLEAIKGLKRLFLFQLKVPIFTPKTGFLFLFSSLFCLLFLLTNKNIVLFLVFDILSPFIFSGIVIVFQPLTVFARYFLIFKAIQKRSRLKNLKVVAITGSYGKSSTKELLAFLLSQKYKTTKTPKNQNSEVGISNWIIKGIKDDDEIFVCEMGAYSKGGIKLLSKIASPQIGIISGINYQHLAVFGSFKNLVSAEGGKELVMALPKNGKAIFNFESTLVKELSEEIKKWRREIKIIFSSPYKKERVWAENIKIEKTFISFDLVSPFQSLPVKIAIIGKHQLENLFLAINCCLELKMSLKEIKEACELIKTENLDLGMKVYKGKNGVDILDSSYSANPDGVMADIDHLRCWQGRKIIVMPCLIELGKKAKETHYQIGKKIAEVCDLAIITTEDNFEDIKRGALGKSVLIKNSQEVEKRILPYLRKENVILFEGRSFPKLIKKIIVQ